MLFNSVTYILFLPVVVLLYWRLPNRARLWLVLLSSVIFYGFWRIEFIPLMLFSAGADYVFALMIERSENERVRRRLLAISVVISLSILCIFKYLIFFTSTAWSISSWLGIELSWPTLKIILPLGISFYIFATISYTVDVYRRLIPAEKSALTYFCFVTFFPHLVAGPILRAGVLMPQLSKRAAFKWENLAIGVRRILQGLFLKVVLADNLAPLVNTAFLADPVKLHGADAWTMAFLFGFQIYFDFSAYSHIAIGSALLMGIVLPENFNFPYVATSPRDFWKRWHISLSTWVRDYLYVPLMGAHPKEPGWDVLAAPAEPGSTERKRTRALFVTWTLMGFWHGANWTFAVWGTYHAFCIWMQRLLNAAPLKTRQLPPFAGWAITLPLMMAAWIPFRAKGLRDAFILWGHMLDPRQFTNLTLEANCYVAAALTLVGMMGVWAWRIFVLPALSRRAAVLRGAETAYYSSIIAFVFVFLEVRDQFIYFQF